MNPTLKGPAWRPALTVLAVISAAAPRVTSTAASTRFRLIMLPPGLATLLVERVKERLTIEGASALQKGAPEGYVAATLGTAARDCQTCLSASWNAPWTRRRRHAMLCRVRRLLSHAYVVVMDDAGTEHAGGWLLVEDGLVAGVGGGERPEADETVDLGGALVTPGLVNTHHHLYQTLTRARAQEATLFEWLHELYPVWARIDAEAEYAAARTGLAELALSGCTTVFDHHYVFPRGREGLIEAEVQAARELGVRIVASRGSMDLGESDGGLPPDELVEEIDHVLAETERLAALQDELVQIAVAPCSPFSATKQLMVESAELARRLGLRLHTHLAETVEEDAYCVELYGCRPVEYLSEVGWVAGDVWCAHCVHLSPEDVKAFGAAGVGVAHCPTSNLRLGAGVAPVRELIAAGAPVGLGVDGSASNERSDLFLEV